MKKKVNCKQIKQNTTVFPNLKGKTVGATAITSIIVNKIVVTKKQNKEKGKPIVGVFTPTDTG